MVWNKRVVTYEEHDASQGTATGFLSVHLQWVERGRVESECEREKKWVRDGERERESERQSDGEWDRKIGRQKCEWVRVKKSYMRT